MPRLVSGDGWLLHSDGEDRYFLRLKGVGATDAVVDVSDQQALEILESDAATH